MYIMCITMFLERVSGNKDQQEVLIKALEEYKHKVDRFIGEGMYCRGRVQPDYDITCVLLEELKK